MTGVDPSGESIGVAKIHAQHNAALSGRLEYLHRDAQSLQEEGVRYPDPILCASHLARRTHALTARHSWT